MEKDGSKNLDYVVDLFDPYYKINGTEYRKNYMDIGDSFPPSTVIMGQTNSGKSVIMTNLLIKKIIPEKIKDHSID